MVVAGVRSEAWDNPVICLVLKRMRKLLQQRRMHWMRHMLQTSPLLLPVRNRPPLL